MTPPPTQIGHYRIIRKLGEGGMGVVYEGVNDTIQRRVAIKQLSPDYARDAEATQRLFNEARAVNLIEHPSLVQISDFGQTADGAPYLVMEFLKGESLGARLQRLHDEGDRLPLAQVLELTAQVAEALAVVHAKGIIHREQYSPSRNAVLGFPETASSDESALERILGPGAWSSSGPERLRMAREVQDYGLGAVIVAMTSLNRQPVGPFSYFSA